MNDSKIMLTEELPAWLVLARAPGMHAGMLQSLLRLLHSPVAILTASSAALRAAGAPSGLFDWLHARTGGEDQEQLAKEQRWLATRGHHFVPWGSADYPALLEQLPDAPLGLFVRGDPQVLALPQLAMVGSRHPTATGRDTANLFAAHLARCGLTITSGLAAGIDTACHQGALEAGGRTIAVCGTGLDIDYPSANVALGTSIAAHGALISEFSLGTPPLSHNFPRRNRLISGLSLGTLVVEATLRSGSLITARLAGEQGRGVFAIPGSIHNPLSRGCHQLIRQGATLVETAQDILNELTPLLSEVAMADPAATAPSSSSSGREVDPGLDKDYKILLDALGFDPVGVDALVARTGFKAEEVASMLLILELEAHIESHPGGRYVRRALK